MSDAEFLPLSQSSCRIVSAALFRGVCWMPLLVALAYWSGPAQGQTASVAGLPLELQLNTASGVISGPEVFGRIPSTEGAFTISGPGILRVTWTTIANQTAQNDHAKGGSFTFRWDGQRQETIPGRGIGYSVEPENAPPGKPQTHVWLQEISADVKNVTISASLQAYWVAQMDQNPWAGINLYQTTQAIRVDWLESSVIRNTQNLSGRWAGSNSSGFAVDLILQEQNNILTGTLGGNPITGKRLPDGRLEFTSAISKQSYRGNFNPETGSIKGTFDCELSNAKDVGWEVTRITLDNNPLLTGGNIELPTKPTHVPTGTLVIQAGVRKVNVGQEVMVPVEIIGGKGLGNLNVVIEYDNKVGQVRQSSKAGEILAGRLFASNPQESGVYRFGFAGNDGLAGDGILTLLPITAIGKPGDKSPLTLTVTAANDAEGQSLESTVISGGIEIVSTGGAGSGDINDDGVVDTLDALAALKMSVKLLPENMAADMDHDGKVTSNDARLIMLKYVGK